eukprot:Clim_evm2s90 gene=Clim_evmTU2s90
MLAKFLISTFALMGSAYGAAQVANQRICEPNPETGAIGGQFTNPNTYDPENSPFVCGDSDRTLDDAREIAYKFAPILHEHPAEPYHMTDVQEFLTTATIYKDDEPQNTTSLPEDIWRFINPAVTLFDAASYRMVAPESGYNGTEPVDGEIQAPVYFTVVEETGFWVYTFTYWFNYNGCGGETMDYINEDNEYITARFIVCQLGIHEGDWESMQVVVCPDTLEVQGITTLGHGDGEFLDCRRDGECDFADGYPADESHINVYIALATHATYTTVGEQYYIYAEIPVLSRVLALWVTDRTSDQGPRFLPTQENVIALPDPSTVTEDDPFNFVAWIGRFGAIIPTGIQTISCLNDETTAIEECPQDDTFQQILDFLGLGEKPAGDLSKFVTSIFPITGDSSGPTGPYAKRQASQLTADDPHPGGLVEDAACPGFVEVSEEDREKLLADSAEARDIRDREVFRDIAIGFLVLLISGIIISILAVLPADEKRTAENVLREFYHSDMEMPNMNESERHWIVLWYTQGKIHFFWVLLIIFFELFGIFTAIPGVIDVTELGEDLVDSNVWETIRNFFIVLLPILGFLDLVALIIVFYSTFYWMKKSKSVKPHHNFKAWNITYSVLAFFELFAMFLSVMLFGVATVAFIDQKLFVEACRGLTDATGISSVCLDLSIFGLNSFACGIEVINFCADIADTRTELIFYGSLFLFLAHLMVVLLLILGVRIFRLLNEFTEALNGHRISTISDETEHRNSTKKSVTTNMYEDANRGSVVDVPQHNESSSGDGETH